MLPRNLCLRFRRPCGCIAGLAAGVLLLLFAAQPARSDTWIEIQSPHFRVFTNGGARSGRQVAESFEKMRWVFATLFPSLRLDSGAPLMIFAAPDSVTEKNLEPTYWKDTHGWSDGDTISGSERQYIMVRTDESVGNIPTIAFHEYTHSVMHMNSRWLPLWLDEGLAEFFGNTTFQDQKVYIGAPTPRVEALRHADIPVRRLIGIDDYSELKDNREKDEFYAESWALVHYLVWLDGGRKMNRFFRAIQSGTDQKKALEEVVGNLEEVNRNLQKMMLHAEFKAGAIKDTEEIDVKSFRVIKLAKAEAEAQVAGFRIWDQDAEAAGPLVSKALADDPKLGIAHEENGFVQFDAGNDAAARKEFERAYELDKSLYLAHYYQVLLSPGVGSGDSAEEEVLRKGLTQVAAEDSSFAPVYIQLALLAVRQKDYKTALSLSMLAESLEPSKAGYHLLTGQILLRLGQYQKAADHAEFVANRWTGPQHNAAVELWNEIPPARRPSGVVLTDASIEGTRTISGIVASTECKSKDHPWSVTLKDGSKFVELNPKDDHSQKEKPAKGKPKKDGSEPDHSKDMVIGLPDTLWWGREHFNICRHLEGMPVVIRYFPGKNPSDAGQVKTLEMRSRLSPILQPPAPQVANAGKAEE